MLTENRRIEKARTPIRRRIKKARTLPKACLTEDTPFWASEAAIDGQIELWRERKWAKKRERESHWDSLGFISVEFVAEPMGKTKLWWLAENQKTILGLIFWKMTEISFRFWRGEVLLGFVTNFCHSGSCDWM